MTFSPGATLGILGNGQLGRMCAQAAHTMGYKVIALGPGDDSPTQQVTDIAFAADFSDMDAVRKFAKAADVVTLEFENIPVETLNEVNRWAPLRPGCFVLETTQHRIKEKTFLQNHGFPVTEFLEVNSLEDLQKSVTQLDCSAILKTAAWGYDGKGQTTVEPTDDLTRIWADMDTDAAILEAKVDFQNELSIMVARGSDGHTVCYEPTLNIHRRHILDVSRALGDFDNSTIEDAQAIARGIVEALDVVGVLCVELFQTEGGKLLVNELAPRPHNSGHLTIDAHVTSQFEQQARAACGLPLGDPTQQQPALMINLLGDLWQNATPPWEKILATPGCHLHLYGKHPAKVGRKMGHLTITGKTVTEVLSRASLVDHFLQRT